MIRLGFHGLEIRIFILGVNLRFDHILGFNLRFDHSLGFWDIRFGLGVWVFGFQKGFGLMKVLGFRYEGFWVL